MAHPLTQSRLPQTRIGRLLSPLSRFDRQGSAGGLVLVEATLVALAWANSPWSDAYHQLWKTYAGTTLGPLEVKHSLGHWINDGLMAVFFFLMGLEIKREVLAGELASVRRTALPAAGRWEGSWSPPRSTPR